MKRTPIVRAAALLLMAALAACSDAPTGAAITAPDQPAFNTAPTVTVTDSGGYPLISWGALAGATSYSVVHKAQYVYVMDGHAYGSTSNRLVGSTTGTSLVDSVFSYTGVSRCGTTFPNGDTETQRHAYVVTATFASGTSTTTVDAPIAEC